jgi:hypothetical protein
MPRFLGLWVLESDVPGLKSSYDPHLFPHANLVNHNELYFLYSTFETILIAFVGYCDDYVNGMAILKGMGQVLHWPLAIFVKMSMLSILALSSSHISLYTIDMQNFVDY